MSFIINPYAFGGAAPAGPLVLDTFTDTNGTLLTAHTPDIGGTWSVNGTWEIQTNRSRKTSSSAHDFALIETGETNVRLTGVLYRLSLSGETGGFAVRAVDNANLWGTYHTNSAVTIQQRVANTFTQRASVTVPNSGQHSTEITVDGSVFTVNATIGGTVYTTSYSSMSVHLSATKAGLWAFNQNIIEHDDFQVEAL